jgi:pimeloyl-ACP methyl ester carboxylesterase
MRVRKGYVDAGEGQVHYREAGRPGGDPPVVLLHQNTSSSDMYVEAMRAFDDDRHVVAPDFPGAGLSFVPERVPGMGYYAAAVAGALDGLGVDRFHVCGHHAGAGVAAELAVSRPDRVRSATFSGPPYLSAAERDRFRDAYDGADAVPPLDAGGEYLLYHWSEHAKTGGTDDLTLRHRAVVDALLGREGIAEMYGAVWDQDFPALFERIEAPRMALCAPDDVLHEAFERLRSEHPDVRTVELGGGNYEPLLDAAAFAATVESFVDGVSPGP